MVIYRKKECIAMLLAGGQGSRLRVLTARQAKPAIPFGGKYRIIDFPLSNCINSGLDTVGVLTQYQPLQLNSYIGNGQFWDLDRLNGGAFILPPYVTNESGVWYKGTANSIYQNIAFVDQFDPDYVMVLGGDHIYKMDYSLMIREHKLNNADCTISVIEVPDEDACRFGIVNTNPDASIYEFEEKPTNPKSNLASMGIYCFAWKKLRQYLIDDENDPTSSNDFGKNVLPKMLENGERMFAYRFRGYWKDVGTIESLWEANMDMLSPASRKELYSGDDRVFGRSAASPPHFVSADATISHSLLTEGCEVYGDVDSSVLFTNVKIGKGAKVRYSILMPGVTVGERAVVEYSILAEDCCVGKDAQVGMDPAEYPHDDWGITVIGASLGVGEGAYVPPGKVVESDVLPADENVTLSEVAVGGGGS